MRPGGVGQVLADASDFELLDAVEVLHRTRAALDLERARVLARLWGAGGSLAA